MLQKMILIAQAMVKDGYHLFNETPEEFATRFYNAGLTADTLRSWHDNYLRSKGA